MSRKSKENYVRVRGKDKEKNRFHLNGKFTSKHLRIQEVIIEKRNEKYVKEKK